MEVSVLDFQRHGAAANAGALAPPPDLVEEGLKLRPHVVQLDQVPEERGFGPDGLADAVRANRAAVNAARDREEVWPRLAKVLLQNGEGLRLQVSPGPDAEPVHPGLGCWPDPVEEADRQSLHEG